MRKSLIEVYQATPKLLLTEDASRGYPRLVVRGEFARAGVPTANKRVYPRRLWEREFERLREAMRNRSLVGELNHPADGRADLFRTSHLVTGLTLTPEGVVLGEAEVMPELPGGKVVAAIYKRNGKVGVSSRGFGSTQVTESGDELVQEDYQLVTFDFVADPADQYAYPDLVTEGNAPGRKVFPVRKPEMKTEAEIRKEFAAKLLQATAEIRATTEAAVFERIQKDPSALPAPVQESLRAVYGGAGSSASAQELAEARAKAKAAEIERDRALVLGRKAVYSLYVERTLRDDPARDAILEAVGDFAAYPTLQDFQAKITNLVEDVQKARALEEEKKRAVEEETRRLAEERDAMSAKLAKTQAALERSLELNRTLGVTNYAQRAGSVAPAGAAAILEAADPATYEDVDAILDAVRVPILSEESRANARARARTMVGSRTRVTRPLHEEHPTRPDHDEMFGLGASWKEIEALSGIDPN